MNKNDFKNKTWYFRDSHSIKNPYTKISNELSKDKRLSFHQWGIFTYILSQSDKYIINIDYIRKH